MRMAPPRKKQRLSTDAVQVNGLGIDTSEMLSTDDVKPTGDETMTSTAPTPTTAETQEQPQAQSQSSSLFVRSLPSSTTTQTLTELFSATYPIKHATAVIDKETQQCKGYGFVTFADHEDAAKAKVEFNGHVLEGKKLRVEIAERRQRDGKKGLAGDEEGSTTASVPAAKVNRGRTKNTFTQSTSTRLIVRNLPWSVKHADQLQALFKKYGKVKKAVLPKKKTGLLAGFGFVMMSTRAEAEKALAEVNGTAVDGRPVAVDWAVDKEQYEQQEDSVLPDADDDQKHEGESDVEDVDDESDDNEDLLDNDDNDDGETKSDVDDELDEDALYDEEMAEKMRNEDRSSTLFIRNLPFTCTDESLEDHFGQFGSTRYARVVMDQATDRSKGTGFVAFYKLEDAETCIRNAPRPQAPTNKDADTARAAQSILQDENRDPSGRYTLEGRVLQISKAVDKSEANRLTKEGANYRFNRDKDKRRLYLLSEGTIPSNSALWESLPPSEQAMRESSAKQRKSIIDSNPSLHLSLTRLSVRNIPRSVNSKDLKQLAREAVVGFATDVKSGKRARLSKEELSRGGEGMLEAEAERKRRAKGIVRQAKIVFEGQEGGKVDEKSGGGRSRGYGFIEYYTHRSALMGLRWLNGHALGYQTQEQGAKKKVTSETMQDRKKRLIVEFAIENAQVVGRRKERESKARDHSKDDKEGNGKGSKKDSKAVSKNGKKRKRDGDAAAKDNDEASDGDDPKKAAADEKLAKKQRIVQRKRMMRRERKRGKA